MVNTKVIEVEWTHLSDKFFFYDYYWVYKSNPTIKQQQQQKNEHCDTDKTNKWGVI